MEPPLAAVQAPIEDSANDVGEPETRSMNASSQRLPPPLVLRSIFVLLGVGVLVPWNAFISAKSYFQSRSCDKFPNFNIESVFATVFNLAAVTSLGAMIAYEAWRDRQTHSEQTSAVDENNPLNHRSHNHDHSLWLVKIPFAVIILTFLLQTVMVLIIELPLFLELTLFCIAMCGMLGGIAQTGVVATAGLFESNIAMNPYVSGQSAGGVAVSLVNFLAASWQSPREYWRSRCGELHRDLETTDCVPYDKVNGAVFLYFFLGSLTLLACLIGYAYVARIQHNYETVPGSDNAAHDESPRIGLELSENSVEQLLVMRSEQQEEPIDHASTANANTSIAAQEDDDEENEMESVWEHIKGPAAAIFLTFVVTLSLFPGWTSELRSVRQCQSTWRLANDLYTPFSFLVFNVGDLTGRLLSAQYPLRSVQNLPKKLVYGSLLRFLFFPILFLCTGGSSSRLHIASDVYSAVAQIAFGVSNGFVLSSAFVLAPSLVPHTSDAQERMSSILNFAVVFGLLCGSLLSFPVTLIMD